MKLFSIFLFLILLEVSIFTKSNALASNTNAPKNKEVLSIDADSLYDGTYDYAKFSGRVTDRDNTTSIVKVSSENRNIKFFRAGDLVEFKIQNNLDADYCQGFVRSIEENYFVIFIKDLSPCFPKEEYFRRGTALIFQSVKLAERVREASVYRASLITKKKDFLGQLNNINQNIWNFEEKKIQIAAEFDKRIAELEKEKIKALDQALSSKTDEIKLQRELGYRLDNIDKELRFYRIERGEPLFDRWHLDQDLGYPVYQKPEEIRSKRVDSESRITD